MNNRQLPFRPFVGKESVITKQIPEEGGVWFATDSKKIYYSDGTSFLSMGENTGIYYGYMELAEQPDSDEVNFDFLLTDIDGNKDLNQISQFGYKIPQKDDLILNIPDGCFYRVINISDSPVPDTIINTVKLTISGSGGGGGSTPGGTANRLTLTDADGKGNVRYYKKDLTSAILNFNVDSLITENNGIVKMECKINDELIPELGKDEWQDFGIISIDITKYLSELSTSTRNAISISIWDNYGTKATITFSVYVIEIELISDDKRTIIPTTNSNFVYSCIPKGGKTLSDREILIKFYDINGNELPEIKKPISSANTTIPVDILIPGLVGVYTMKVWYRGKTPDKTEEWQYSNSLVYQIVYYDENPVLAVDLPKDKIEQYSTLTISYMIAADIDSIDEVAVKLIKNNIETDQSVKFNELKTWDIYFDQPGFYDLTIRTDYGERKFENIEVFSYQGSLPSIQTEGLTLNLSPVNRSNNEVQKDSWTYGDYYCNFVENSFAWGNINGWLKDESNVDILRLSSGAKMEIPNFYPYDGDTTNFGQTIELNFKISGVTDFSAPLIKCLSYSGNDIQVGFQITGQESTFNTNLIKTTGNTITENEKDQVYNTQIQGLTTRFVENERIHLTWVVEPDNKNYPMIKTYLNGQLCGITQYDKEADNLTHNAEAPAYLIFDSAAGTIDIYNIRIYKTIALESDQVLKNYIASIGSLEEKTNKYKYNTSVSNDNEIDINQIETNHKNEGFNLPLPYIKIIGGSGLIKDDNGYKINNMDAEIHLPIAKKDYRLIKKYEFVDHLNPTRNKTLISNFNQNNYLNGLVMYGQGTSSMEYPVKNLRIKAKMKDENGQKIKFNVEGHEVDLICLKADYMESSGSHNTGTGNLIYELTQNMDNMLTPGQQHYQNTVSAIRGFPVLVFFKDENEPESSPYEFVGKYNFNLDKATPEPYGFQYDEENHFGIGDGYKEVRIKNEEAFNGYPFPLFKENNGNYQEVTKYDSSVKQYYSVNNKIHCFEFLNNANNLDNFLIDEGKTFEETFDKIVNSKGKDVPYWYTCFESRYPEFEDYDSTDVESWRAFCKWVASTKDNLEKFKNEFDDHLNFNFTCFYYILSHVLLMIDSRAKNLMMATWDDEHWFPIFYDMDTMLGLNNYGYNKYSYDVEDTDANVYNGQNSVLWNNFREAFPERIQAFYQTMQEKGLTYEYLIENYSKQADVVSESIYNADSQYKYIRPFSEGFIDSSGEVPVEVAAGARDYLYASQGSRSMYRKWWLKNRINYFNGKYLSNGYKGDKYILRLYTPSSEEGYYVPQYNLTKDEFDNNIQNNIKYFIKDGNNYIETREFNEGQTYYIYVSDTEKLDASLKAVEPNNDFALTPLHNQYLSVAFGGDNGITAGPYKTRAGEEKIIEAPEGALYNDTETYLYGGSMLKNLGDLSYQYLGQFHMPNEPTKLETLILGNPHNDYYNPNFSSLVIGNNAPYLKTLDLTNCSGLKGRSQDVSACQNLEYFYATGTGLGNISLPSYGILKEVRLPETITSLKLNNQPLLNDDNFSIGSCYYTPASGDQPEQKDYKDINKEGTTPGKIIELQVENTHIDTYSIIKNNGIQRFYLPDINWIINIKNDINKENNTINVLEKLLKAKSAKTNYKLSQSLIGTIELDCDKLELTVDKAMAMYQKYAIGDEESVKNGKYFPNINFIFKGLNIFDVNIKDGNNKIYWTKKIKGGEKITKEFLSSGPNGKFKIPSMSNTTSHVHTFTNKWYINNKDNDPIDGSSDAETEGWPILETLINSNITLIPVFESSLQKYTIIFTDKDKFEKKISIDYGTPILNFIPQEIPYKDDSELELNKTFKFQGYTDNTQTNKIIEFTQDMVVTGDKTYIAVFEEVSVYDNVNEDYFEFIYHAEDAYLEDLTRGGDSSWNITEGYSAKAKADKKLQGKITIPAMHNGLPVVEVFSGDGNDTNLGFRNNTKITHIFFEDTREKPCQIRKIGKNAFFDCSNLKYFEWKDSMRHISENAFRHNSIVPNSNTIRLGENLYYLEYYAFSDSFNSSSSVTIMIPSSVIVLDYRSFTFQNNLSKSGNIIEIGTSEVQSKLDLYYSPAGQENKFVRIDTNYSEQYGTINFYTNKYSADSRITDEKGNSITPLDAFSGVVINVINNGG